MTTRTDACRDANERIPEILEGTAPPSVFEHIASCDDCHEPHRVLPPDDPMSTIHMDNKLKTCRQCHDDAGPNFREIQVHVASGPLPEDTKLRIATLWMLAILIFTFGFFGWLTVLGIRHEWRHGRHQRHGHAGGGST